jgi:hypothetical protein
MFLYNIMHVVGININLPLETLYLIKSRQKVVLKIQVYIEERQTDSGKRLCFILCYMVSV